MLDLQVWVNCLRNARHEFSSENSRNDEVESFLSLARRLVAEAIYNINIEKMQGYFANIKRRLLCCNCVAPRNDRVGILVCF
ncbi:MAG: hypothetical protein SOW25_04860 [Helicobacter sp.]|nr:hypothetical protein [Helicobacteraceae bacterium]MDY3113643.1 hypothetical protein [Helicobacter sp.]